MDYLYDHDDVESLGFGINSCDYDGLDYEDRRDRISTDLAKLGLSFSDAFNSLDIIGEERSRQKISLYSGIREEALSVPVPDGIFSKVVTVDLGAHHHISICMTYTKDGGGSRIKLTGVKFYQLNSTIPISLDICTSFKYDADSVLGGYSSIQSAINCIKRWMNDHATDPQWSHIVWRDLGEFTVPYDTCRTYIVRVIAIDDHVHEIGMIDSTSDNISNTINITKFVGSLNAFDLYTLKDIIQTAPLKIGLQSCYDAATKDIQSMDMSMLDFMTRSSYKFKSLIDTISFIEKYWYLAMHEYESRDNGGYRVRAYVDDSNRIRAYAVVNNDRIVYYKDNIDISIGSSSVTKGLTNTVLWIHDPFLTVALGSNSRWTIRHRNTELYEDISRQTEWDVRSSSIAFNDGIHSLKIVTRNGKILAASLYSHDNLFNVKPFILKINNKERQIMAALREKAFQDAIINYAISEDKPLENLIPYFKASSKTVDDFNNAIRGYEFFDYGEDAVCTNEYMLRLYYERILQHITVTAISIIGLDGEVIYCQTFNRGPSKRIVRADDTRVLCWKYFLTWCGLLGSGHDLSFKTIILALGSGMWNRDVPCNVMQIYNKQQPLSSYQPLPEPECSVFGSDGKYKMVRIVTDSHLYIAKVLIKTVIADWVQGVPVIQSTISVEDIYALKDHLRQHVDILRGITFRNLADMRQLIQEKIDPMLTNQHNF